MLLNKQQVPEKFRNILEIYNFDYSSINEKHFYLEHKTQRDFNVFSTNREKPNNDKLRYPSEEKKTVSKMEILILQ